MTNHQNEEHYYLDTYESYKIYTINCGEKSDSKLVVANSRSENIRKEPVEKREAPKKREEIYTVCIRKTSVEDVYIEERKRRIKQLFDEADEFIKCNDKKSVSITDTIWRNVAREIQIKAKKLRQRKADIIKELQKAEKMIRETQKEIDKCDSSDISIQAKEKLRIRSRNLEEIRQRKKKVLTCIVGWQSLATKTNEVFGDYSTKKGEAINLIVEVIQREIVQSVLERVIVVSKEEKSIISHDLRKLRSLIEKYDVLDAEAYEIMNSYNRSNRADDARVYKLIKEKKAMGDMKIELCDMSDSVQKVYTIYEDKKYTIITI